MDNYNLEFEIQGLPKMTNTLRLHWSAKMRHAQLWKGKVRVACHGKKPNQPLTKATLTFIRCSSREPDFDGLVSSFKNVQDGLVECGILVDDKQSNIGQPKYFWEKAKVKQGKIKVKVEEINDETTPADK